MLAVAVLDNGISNNFNGAIKRSIFERDYVFNDNETDTGDPQTHGTRVADSVVRTNDRLDLIDARVGNAQGTLPTDAEEGLQGMIDLLNQGYRIGAINCSFGSASASFSSGFDDEVDLLAARGTFTVCASGNSGSRTGLEAPSFPAALQNAIAVGSHDGGGNPSSFSQQGRGRVVVLADGEDFPNPGENGTSFAAPQVAATVATVQGSYMAATGQSLTLNQMIDVLQQGGRGPLSAVDPADRSTRYFLHDHAGSVNYAMQAYVEPNFNAFEYLATYNDLRAAFGIDAVAAHDHFVNFGIYEGRSSTFDAASYAASYADLTQAFGTDRNAAAFHYLTAGLSEGRQTTFDANAYLDANADLLAAFGNNTRSAALHYISMGRFESRVLAINQSTNETGADFASSAATAGRLAIGRSVTATISSGVDTDWYKITLAAGQTVIVEARGSATGGGTLGDPIIYLRAAGGSILASDDDSGSGLDSRLVFTPAQTSAYFVEVDGFGTSSAGTYTLSATRLHSGGAIAAPLAATGGDEPDDAGDGAPALTPVDGYFLV
ncbi:MAG: hypothetical protein FJX35_18735 [Alphaproteobacteria bacterium]|nr:hypothetical protein [Alphaproteobacteria bacterium]